MSKKEKYVYVVYEKGKGFVDAITFSNALRAFDHYFEMQNIKKDAGEMVIKRVKVIQ